MDNTIFWCLYVLTLPYAIQFYCMLFTYAKARYLPSIKKFSDRAILITRVICALIKLYALRLWHKKFPPKEDVKIINRSTAEVSYTFRDTEYKFRTKIKRGVPEVIRFEDENGVDITESLSPYIGPGEDFHRLHYTPSEFGYQKITVFKGDDQPLVFEKEEEIIL
jgi:hypothetical protein